MYQMNQIPQENLFSPQFVYEHLQKMFCDPVFSVSDILKRFLSFIITETMEGRPHLLKEYTIGINVLNKPPEFNPQADGIVRIHAGRLRRALNQYYMGTGKSDTLRISVPKGNYIPFFFEAGSRQTTSGIPSETAAEFGLPEHGDSDIKVAVSPLNYFMKEDKMISFAEGIASQLSSTLAGNHRLIVIAYNPLRYLYSNPFHFKDALLKAGVQFLYTGDIQFHDNRIRVNIQMINAVTGEQIWGNCYDRKLEGICLFDIQDEIIKRVVTESGSILNPKKTARPKLSTMAVA